MIDTVLLALGSMASSSKVRNTISRRQAANLLGTVLSRET
jgi:hypothetical protein